VHTNAFSRNRTRLYRVWGDDMNPPYVDLPDGTPLVVIYSPTLRQWIGSVTNLDFRYDAILSTSNFVLDASLLPVDGPAEAGSYYLNRVRASAS
jgi:hypothetical protein